MLIKTLLLPWPHTSQPWIQLHADFAGPIKSKHYLVLVDSYSKWPEVSQMNSLNEPATINVLSDIFSHFGFPESLVTDNGPSFQSDEFQRFCMQHGIRHIFALSYHPQSNGLAEQFVDTFKRTLSKINEGSEDKNIRNFLIHYRNTVHPSTNNSPVMLLRGRKLCSSLDSLLPSAPSSETTADLSFYFNRSNRARPRAFQVQDAVYARLYNTSQKYTPAVITCKGGEVLYELVTNSGEQIVKHSNQIRARDQESKTL